MKLLKGLDPFQVVALLLLSAPALGLLVFGLVALWRADHTLLWLSVFLACGMAGYGLQQWCMRRDRRLLTEAMTEPAPDWPPEADAVWQKVEALAESLQPDDWPLDDGGRLWALGRQSLETVARAYHPDTERPLLELTLPHTLMIIERASRDLRADIVAHVPLSHRLKIGDLLRAQRWKAQAEKLFDVYRAGRVIINPLDALLGEAWRQLRNRSFGLAQLELQRWLLRAYVRKVGYYAIDLYSGRLPLDDASVDSGLSASNTATPAGTPEPEADAPLVIVVAGRSNAGKSSLINALFGQLKTATDVLAGSTDRSMVFELERDGLTRAHIIDTPGCDDEAGFEALFKNVAEADLVLWVSMLTRPDRATERAALDQLRHRLAQRRNRRPPPIVLVASGMDRLRPAGEWSPPYNLLNPDQPKARSVRAAVEALAVDLDVNPQQIVPVCLQEGRSYNVEDSLWSAMLGAQDEARRARLLRCLESRRRAQDWTLLWQQLRNAGRVMGELPDKLIGQLRR